MSFWGLQIEPKKMYTQVLDSSFKLTMAALGGSAKEGRCSLMVRLNDDLEFLLCSLYLGKVENQPLDLLFSAGEKITFFTKGESDIHLTGFYTGEEDFDDMQDMDFDGELSEEDVSEDMSEDEEVSEEEIEDMKVVEVVEEKQVAAQEKPKVNKQEKKQDKKEDKKIVQLVEEEAEEVSEDDDEEVSEDGDEEDEEEMDEEEEEALLREIIREEHGDIDEATMRKLMVELREEMMNVADEESGDEESEEEVEEMDKKRSKSNEKSNKKQKISSTPQKVEDMETKKVEKKHETKTPEVKKNEKKNEKTPEKAKAEKNQKQDNKENKKEKTAENKVEEKTPAKGEKNVGEKKVLPSGLTIEDVRVGNGTKAKAGRRVSVYYVGKLTNGKVFDSKASGKPFTFTLGKGEVIKGWDIGLSGMAVGSERRLTIPPSMAYGSEGAAPDIPKNATLIFDVKLAKVQ